MYVYKFSKFYTSFHTLGWKLLIPFDLDYLYEMTLSVYHHNASFEKIATVFNDSHSLGLYN